MHSCSMRAGKLQENEYLIETSTKHYYQFGIDQLRHIEFFSIIYSAQHLHVSYISYQDKASV